LYFGVDSTSGRALLVHTDEYIYLQSKLEYLPAMRTLNSAQDAYNKTYSTYVKLHCTRTRTKHKRRNKIRVKNKTDSLKEKTAPEEIIHS
jgi:hypothetical protein